MNSDDLLAAIKSRRSIRKFTDQLPTRQNIERLIEAAGWAPSNHNRQGWKFVVLQDRLRIQTLAEQTRQAVRHGVEDAPLLIAGRKDELVHFAGVFEKAPVIILAMHKKSPAMGRSMANPVDDLVSGEALSTAMAVQNLLLAANILGLGACVMTAPLLARKVWMSLPDLPAGFEPTCLVAVGYPDERPEPPRRKHLEHILEYR